MIAELKWCPAFIGTFELSKISQLDWKLKLL